MRGDQAGELDGGLTRTNFITAMRAFEGTSPVHLDGIRINLNGNADGYPLEACGLLIGLGTTVHRFVPCANVAGSARVYTIDPREHGTATLPSAFRTMHILEPRTRGTDHRQQPKLARECLPSARARNGSAEPVLHAHPVPSIRASAEMTR